MVFSIKVTNSNDGKICIDGQKANAKIFSDYIKGSVKKEVTPSGYKIIIHHTGTPYAIDGHLLAKKSEFVSSLIKLFKSPLQLDFSDCSRVAIERVIHYLKTGEENFDPLEVTSIYDVVVKLDIRPLRMAMKRRIDNAIVGLNAEKQLSKIQSRSRSRVRSQKRGINEYKQCFDEIYELLKAIDKFNGNFQAGSNKEEQRSKRSIKKSNRKKASVSRGTNNMRGRSMSRTIHRNINSIPRTLSNVSRKSRSISRPISRSMRPRMMPSNNYYNQRSQPIDPRNMLRDLSQLSSKRNKKTSKKVNKKEVNSKKGYKGQSKKSHVQENRGLSPYKKELMDDGIITINPYFNQNNVFVRNQDYLKNEQSNPPSSFTTDTTEETTAISIRNSNNSIPKKHKGFKSVKRSEGFNTWLNRKNKQRKGLDSKDDSKDESKNGHNNVF